MIDFDSKTLPEAVATLFRLNNYTVEGPLTVHGAEVDLKATSRSDPFAPSIYIEVTVSYVDNTKYGLDVGKLAMIREADSGARLIIVSSRGFSAPVVERARATRIDTLNYTELFAKFEQFEPYVRSVLRGEDVQAQELQRLSRVYEEPYFQDTHGRDSATAWLRNWSTEAVGKDPWIVVVGEYGTGKTALTKIALKRWLESYETDPSLPIPFRIELRDFTKQFDADGLLQHFLRNNSLGHISLDFVWSLIRSGRIVLLLDGYDEMAQYLSARERRVCLESLADLSAGGARGLLTSRPNYFSEAEEFHLFDVLYRNIEVRSPLANAELMDVRRKESALDDYIEKQFLQRYERSLQDLTPEQTEELVRRTLEGDREGATVVIEILRRVFRTADEGTRLSLSGKPVIISYLLDVVDQLKDLGTGEQSHALTEWDVYTLVIDQLMLRDLVLAGRVSIATRRRFLHSLALWLTRKENAVIDEPQFRELIGREFKSDLRRYDSSQRQAEIENYYQDLRRSGTLSRSTDPASPGWRFSHNSLREFLLTEYMLDELKSGRTIESRVPINDAMRLFAQSQPVETLREQSIQLSRIWGSRSTERGVGQVLLLLWNGLVRLAPKEANPALSVLRILGGNNPALDHLTLQRVVLSTVENPTDLAGVRFDYSELAEVGVAGSTLAGCSFTESFLETVDFSDADLTGAVFRGSVIVDVNLSRATLKDADFRDVHPDSSILVETADSGIFPTRLEGAAAFGHLAYSGARTDPIDSYSVLSNHPNFSIVYKICAKFNEHSPRQRLGLEQKGAAARDVPFARRFVNHLVSCGFVEVQGGRQQVLFVTPSGRSAFAMIISDRALPAEIERFLRSE